jgi:hypothetical protein
METAIENSVSDTRSRPSMETAIENSVSDTTVQNTFSGSRP